MKSKSPGKRRALWITIGTILIILIVFRMMLPSIVLRAVNGKLSKIEGYEGSAADVDIFLLAGSYTIKDIKLSRTGGKISVPFFAAKAMELSVEWKALLKGEMVGEVEVEEPQLNYVHGPTENTTQTSIDNDWARIVNELAPLRINRFEVNHGSIHYRDFHNSPEIDMAMSDVYLLANNLTNADDKGTLLPATVYGSGSLYDGNVVLKLRLNPLNETPLFDMDAELSTMSLANMNDFLKAYTRLDVQKGTLSLYAEAAARETKIQGYAKPVVKDMNVLRWKDEGGTQSKTAASTSDKVAWVFRSHAKGQPATPIKFEGSMKQAGASTWSIIGETLKNTFMEALIPSVEKSIAVSPTNRIRKSKPGNDTVALKNNTKEEKKKEGFIKRIFKKKRDKDKSRKDDQGGKDDNKP